MSSVKTGRVLGEYEARHLWVSGTVQGLGFRPSVLRRAQALNLVGWVANSLRGVEIRVQGSPQDLAQFEAQLRDHPLAPDLHIQGESSPVDSSLQSFHIRQSLSQGERRAEILPDRALCSECRLDVLDPANRRYQYPFTSCCDCGPRYSILESLPFDRERTTLKTFPLCAACEAEYQDPQNRRCHAQTITCPECGPQLRLIDSEGEEMGSGQEALREAVRRLKEGQLVALKGLGGFQLLADARNGQAVTTLRFRKGREAKPFALLVSDLDQARQLAQVSPAEGRLLLSPQGPIVLLKRNSVEGVSPEVAPGSSWLGIMLPTTPLHLLLSLEMAGPLVATSGNRSEEPLVFEDDEALERLSGLADVFLTHNRPIARPLDDSVARMVEEKPLLMRRARGYAPGVFPIAKNQEHLWAVGGQLKNTVTLCLDGRAFLGSYQGDLDPPLAREQFRRGIVDMGRLYGARLDRLAGDFHPDYFSSRWARDTGRPFLPVQHHHAHLAACLAEHRLEGQALGVIWDGTGDGGDGTVWGGEFLWGDARGVQRIGHLRPFSLPGGDKAVREGRRAALGLLWEIFGPALFEQGSKVYLGSMLAKEWAAVHRMLERGVNSPRTTSMGRLFDGVASLIGLCHFNRFEGEAAMKLEGLAEMSEDPDSYPMGVTRRDDVLIYDWEYLVRGLLSDRERGVPGARLASKFHNTLVNMVVESALRAGVPRVVLSGGCFQNATLLSRAARALREKNIEAIWPLQCPPNDGGLSLGQAVVAQARWSGGF